MPKTETGNVALSAAAMLAALIPSGPVLGADFKINPPSIEPGEISLEDNSAVISSRGRSTDSKHSHFAELGYGVTEYWWTEIEGHWESGQDGIQFRTVDLENAFRVLRQGAWWPETAIFIEYDHAVDRTSPETATLGGLFRKDFGPSSTVLNILFDHDLGRNARTGVTLRYTGLSTWQIVPELAPGIEVFGAAEKVPHFSSATGQDHRLGPAVGGSRELAGIGEFGNNVAYLFGLTPTSPNGTVIWRLEFDVRF